MAAERFKLHLLPHKQSTTISFKVISSKFNRINGPNSDSRLYHQRNTILVVSGDNVSKTYSKKKKENQAILTKYMNEAFNRSDSISDHISYIRVYRNTYTPYQS